MPAIKEMGAAMQSAMKVMGAVATAMQQAGITDVQYKALEAKVKGNETLTDTDKAQFRALAQAIGPAIQQLGPLDEVAQTMAQNLEAAMQQTLAKLGG